MKDYAEPVPEGTDSVRQARQAARCALRSALRGGSPPEATLRVGRFRELLNERLESLSDWQTEIFEMRHFENLSIPEISRRTSRSSDAVRSSLYRVKRMFFDAALANSLKSGSANGGLDAQVLVAEGARR